MGDELVVGFSIFGFVSKKFTNQFVLVVKRDEVIFFTGFLSKLFQ